MKPRSGMTNFLNTDIYGITADEFALRRGSVETVKLMLDAGIKVIQYREKDKYARQMYQECQAIRDITRQAGATFIINDHVDLAMLVGADGIHVGQDDLPVREVRNLVGEEMVIGLSTHAISQADEAAKLGAIIDYIGVGPIFPTNTKKDVCDAVGLEYLDYVVKNIQIPFVAIGGIKTHNIAEVRRRGAQVISLVTEIVGVVDVSAKVRELRGILANNT